MSTPQNRCTAVGQVTPAMRSLAARLVSETVEHGPLRTVSAQHYLDAGRFAQERERLFGQLPVPLCPSVSVRPGQSLAHDHYGVPLIVTRDRQGSAHVLLNVCRHRGTRLINHTEAVDGSRLVCPYHAWTYRLDGSLQGVPLPECFGQMDYADYRLSAFAAVESGGLVWTRLDGNTIEDVGLGDIRDDFAAFGLASAVVCRQRTHRVQANWKLIMDAFLESYHVQRLHRNTIASFFADAVAVSDRVGLHFRSAVARTDYQNIRKDDSLEALRARMTLSYSLLPAAVIVASPDYVNVMLMYPQRPDETRVQDFMLIPAASDTDEWRSHWQDSFELLDGGVFGAEDFEAAEAGQRGLASGGLDTLTLGSAEQAVAEFHQTLAQLLGDAGA